MDDGDHEGLHTAFHNDPRFLVATTIATLVIAGSAYIWRSNPRLLLLDSHQRGEHPHGDPDSERVTADHKSAGPETSNIGIVSSKETIANTALAVNDELGNRSDAKDLKNSRPKERRRRGKDPLKDIIKSGKKIKNLGKSSRVDDAEDNIIGSPTSFLNSRDSTRFSHSREPSLATSSTSVSSTSHSNSTVPLSKTDWASSQGDNNDEQPASSSAFMVSDTTGMEPQSSLLVVETSDQASGFSSTSRDSDLSLQPQTPEFPNISLSTSSSTSHTSSVFSSNSGVTPNTSPTLSLSGKTPTLAQAGSSSSSSPRISSNPIPNSINPPFAQQVQKAPGPWDWDGAGPSPSSDVVLKPPRFRSKSKGAGPIPIPSSLQTLSSTPASSEPHPLFLDPSSPSTTSTIPSQSVGSHDDVSVPLTFPTLNSVPGAISGSPVSPVPSRTANNAISIGTGANGNTSVYGNGSGSGSTRRAPTPRCPPNSGTNTPPLSAQTQLASLRGALEAARMREEKTKIDMERHAKDLEVMRWENAAARRREVELQAQVHHLMHQLQTYATAFATVSGQPSPIAQHHNSTSNTNVSGPPNPLQNGYHFQPPPVPGPHSPPMHLQIPSPAHMLGMLSPTMLSPMSQSHSGPHSPFYPYSSHSPLAHHSHPHLQQNQSPHQPSLYSMMFPHVSGTNGTGSRPSSVAGSSSAGSRSPDLNGSPSPASASLDRGKRGRQTKIQPASAQMGEHTDAWEDYEGDLEETDVHNRRRMDNEYIDDSDGEQVNEILAGAILKRPESIRNLSSKKGKVKARESEVQEHAEFTFPSLSSFGTAIRQHNTPTEIPEDNLTGPSPTDELETEETDMTVNSEEVTPPALPPPMPELSGQLHQDDPH
ncbi:hypothetical protein BDZ94DRAFT_1306608 [Collybia nuda]|uniref:Uncharacterized protein n=1 Tax=Collybia nuda TaxID=64659 RepID=A0A9P5YBY9_9AGAR|nr:hypothetical protein BDZ94DRAFT_1306608 [Collybia nuda]